MPRKESFPDKNKPSPQRNRREETDSQGAINREDEARRTCNYEETQSERNDPFKKQQNIKKNSTSGCGCGHEHSHVHHEPNRSQINDPEAYPMKKKESRNNPAKGRNDLIREEGLGKKRGWEDDDQANDGEEIIWEDAEADEERG